MSHTLVGAIGYRNLRDHSAAFAVLERLEEANLGRDVVLEDVSYNPIALVQWLDSRPAAARFGRVILISGIAREGRIPGTVTVREWDRQLPPDDLIQQAVAEAVTGIISLDNSLIIAGYFGTLPAAVTILEIEPQDHAFGAELSAPVARAVAEAVARVRELTGSTERAP
jgi:hydrogenase maturation protease